MTRASVIVPVYNGRAHLDSCFASIPEWAEVIAVDDGSTDGAPEHIAEHHPRVRLLWHEENRGFGAACNTGMRAAAGEVRVVLNSDARFRAGALEALVAACETDGVGVAGARRVFPDGSHQTSAANFPTVGGIIAGSFLVGELWQRIRPGAPTSWQLALSRAQHEESADVDWVSGTCLAVSGACFEATGGFDEQYHLYVEETDLCFRAKTAGFRVRYLADAVVEHVGGGSTGDPVVHAQRFLRSEARFFAQSYGEASLPAWRRARIVGSAVKVVVLAAPALASRRVRDRWRWQWSALRTMVRRGHEVDA